MRITKVSGKVVRKIKECFETARFYWRVRNERFFYEYSESWDVALNTILDIYSDTAKIDSTDYTIDFFSKGGNMVEVWVGNEFYSFGYLRRVCGVFTEEDAQFRPKKKTMLRLYRLKRKLLEERKEELKKDVDNFHNNIVESLQTSGGENE